MNLGIFLSILLVILYFGYGAMITDWRKELKEILGYAVVIALLLIWGTYFLMFSGGYKQMESYIYILFIAISFLIAYKIFLLSKTKPLDVLAKQQSYWNIPHQDIYNKFRNKLEIKSDRVEVSTNELEKKIYRRYSNSSELITGNIFLAIQNLELTKISNLNEINSELYNTIFQKIKSSTIKQEEDVNFDEILKENENYLEYFLIDCWDRYTKRINVGIAPLNVIAKTFTEQELLGALDNVCLSSVKRNGAALYFKYMQFKNLLPQISQAQEEDEQEEDEYF
jgi:hypothetical protein